MAKVQASTDTVAREVRDLRGMVAAELDGSDHPLLMELVNGYGRGEGLAGYMNEYQPLAWNIDVTGVKDFREHLRDVENQVEDLFEHDGLVPRVVLCGRATEQRKPTTRGKSRKKP